MSYKVLLAEDDENLGFVIRDHLTHEGFEVVHAKDGREALHQFGNHYIDCCIIDVMMPRMDGFTLAEKIRKQNELTPILFLTAKSLEDDRLKGFEIGGDDYITKPFSIKELTYRVKVFLRRKTESAVSKDSLKLGELRFDSKNLLIASERGSQSLTQMEADLLKILIENRNDLIKREEILEKVWGENDYFKGRSLDVFISRLRKYLSEDPQLEIRNHHGVGFTLIDHNFSR